MNARSVLLGLIIVTTGCSREAAPPAPTADPSPVTLPSANLASANPTVAPTLAAVGDYAGRWTGVEGMFLDVKPGLQPGRFSLTMQYDLDHRDTVVARLDRDTLVFTRNGETLTLRPTDGTATGLKYLAGKKHCLTVKSGEGYCRD